MSRFKQPKTLDALRAAYPLYGVAVYALSPGGPVTIEILPGDDIRTRKVEAPTFDEALALLFAGTKPARKPRAAVPVAAPPPAPIEDEEDPLA